MKKLGLILILTIIAGNALAIDVPTIPFEDQVITKMAIREKGEDKQSGKISERRGEFFFDYNLMWGPEGNRYTPEQVDAILIKLGNQGEAAFMISILEQQINSLLDQSWEPVGAVYPCIPVDGSFDGVGVMRVQSVLEAELVEVDEGLYQ